MVEVVVAIGVVTVGVVSLIGLLPHGLRAGRDSINETRAAEMAQTIFSTLRAYPFRNSEYLLYGEGPIDLGEPIAESKQPYRFYADGHGTFITNTTELKEPQADFPSFYLNLYVEPNPPGFVTNSVQGCRGSKLTLKVGWLPNTNTPLTFVSIIGNTE